MAPFVRRYFAQSTMLSLAFRDQARFIRILKLVSSFSAGQVALQLVTAFTSVCLIRWLNVADYARFGLSVTFQSSIGMMMDVGISTAIIALAGSSPALLGCYIRAGLRLRSRLLVAAAVVGGAAFAFLATRLKWPLGDQATTFGIILIGLLAQFWVSTFGIALILQRRFGAYYAIQTAAAALRLPSVYCLKLAHLLSAEPALLSGALSSVCVAIAFRSLTKQCWAPEAAPDPMATGQILRYIAPLAPSVIFLSIQNQAVVFIVSYFGIAKSVAEVAVLGRLGQMFLLLAAFNGFVLAPTFAGLKSERLFAAYLRTVTAATGVAGAAGCIALAWPSTLLWILGRQYAGLAAPLRYVVAAACLNFLSSALWSIHSARKWVYWWSTWLYIGLILTVQVAGIAFLDVSTTLGASQLALVTASAVLVVHAAVGIHSLRGHRILIPNVA